MTTNSSSSASSDDENYYSAAEYIVSPDKQGSISNNNKSSSALLESLNDLHEATHDAIEFVNHCASFQPPKEDVDVVDDDDDDNVDIVVVDDDDDDDDDKTMGTPTNPWKNTDSIAEHLEQARSRIDQAWKTAKEVHGRLKDEDHDYEVGDEDDDDENENETDTLKPPCEEDPFSNKIDFTVPVQLDMVATTTLDSSSTENGGGAGMVVSSRRNVNQDGEEVPAYDEEDEDFRALYMDMMTETLGDDLEAIHQESNNNNNNFDVDVLVECLSSGMQFMRPNTGADAVPSKAFFESLGYNCHNSNDDGTDQDETMQGRGTKPDLHDDSKRKTIHSMRQRRLGYLVVNGDSERQEQQQ